jgi:hypothetical protein
MHRRGLLTDPLTPASVPPLAGRADAGAAAVTSPPAPLAVYLGVFCGGPSAELVLRPR